jgi:hypothetical protein
MALARSLLPEFGGTVRATMPDDLFPDDDDGGLEPKRVATLLTPDQHDDLSLVVEAWNAMHKALGRKGRGWAVMSVAKRMILAGVESFLRKHGGHPSWSKEGPMSPEERQAVVKRAVADVKKRK